MRARIQKWGNSLAIRIPRSIAEEAGMGEGGAVELSLKDGIISLRALPQAKWQLDALVAGITDENMHGEQDAGPAAGAEAW